MKLDASVLANSRGNRPPVEAIKRCAWSVPEWGAMRGFGPTFSWELVKQGKVKARKIGRRTIITEADDREFVESLPLANGDAA